MRPGRVLWIALAGLGCSASTPRPIETPKPVATGPLDALGLYLDCNAGHGDACNDLGVLKWEDLQRGRSDGTKEAAPEPLFKKACALHEPIACNNQKLIELLLRYSEDRAPEDASSALSALKTLCEAGAPPACFVEGAIRFGMPLGIGQLEIEPRRDQLDPSAGADRFEKVCQHGSPDGCVGLGIAYQLGRGRPVASGLFQEVAAMGLLDAACEANTTLACNDTALLESSTDVREYASAAKKWLAACELGLSSSCVTLAVASERTRFYAKRISERFDELLLHACMAGHNDSACDPDVEHKPESHSPPGRMLARLAQACTKENRSGCSNLKLSEVFAECVRTQGAWACGPFTHLPSTLERVHGVPFNDNDPED